MTVPNPEFTPNPDRAIHLQGVIDQQMVYRVTPQIVSLQHKSREPITVYIDSPGGLTDYKDTLSNLLGASDQDFAGPCSIITVAMSLAASAAADLLSSGDYALAYPDSAIMYHGVRVPPDRSLTIEEAYRLAQRLRTGNENFATQLARDAEPKFMFRFISHYKSLDGVRQEQSDSTMSDLDAFLVLIGYKISESANQIVRKARSRYLRYDSLLDLVTKKWVKGSIEKKSFVQLEVEQIKAIVDFEVRQNKKNKAWKFESGGIDQLTDDFFLLNEYLAFFQGKRFISLVRRWGAFVLAPEERKELENISDAGERDGKLFQLVDPRLRDAWSFFMALCHVLQQGENHLTALDAFWLGLIDDVIGIEGLPTFRLFSEFAKESAKKEKQKSEEKIQADDQKGDAAGA